MKKSLLGKSGEDYCVRKLLEEGYEIIERNFRSPYGEIDIVAKDGSHLVFIEVKTRSNDSVEHTKCDISFSKQMKITKTAMFFLVSYQNPEILEYRFDVIIILKTELRIDFNHFKNAFPPAEVGDFFA